MARIAMHVFAQTPMPRPDRSHHCFQDSAALLSTIALATSESPRSRRLSAGLMIAFAALGRRARRRARLCNATVA